MSTEGALKEAEAYLKSANKSAKKKLFSKADPEGALSDYREAAKIFVKLEMMGRAKDAFICAAEAAVNAKMEQPAAVFYREAAECAAKQLNAQQQSAGGNADAGASSVTKLDVAALHRKCADYMCLAGKFVEAAREYVVVCKHLDDKNEIDKTMKQALEYFEQEKKPMQACSTIMDLIDTICLDESQINNTIQLVERARNMYRDMNGYGFKIDLLTLLYVILLLYMDDIDGAKEQLLKFDSYKDSAAMAEDLIGACDKGDRDALEEAKKNMGGRLSLTNNMLRLLDRLNVSEKTDAERYL